MKLTAFIINLSRRPERWKRAQELWSPWFKLVRIEAADIRYNPALGCKMSHATAAEIALTTEPMAIVLEDDAEPTPAFSEIGLQCIEEAKRRVDLWQLICCGPFLDLRGTRYNRMANLYPTPSDLFLRTDYFHQTHFMLYNRRSLRLLQSAFESALPLDIHLATAADTAWTPIKLLATQTDGKSDIGMSPQSQKPWYRKSETLLNQYEPTITHT